MEEDNRLGRIEGKLDNVSEKLDNVDTKVTRLEVHVAKNTGDLDEHMKRTELNETRILRLEKAEQWVRGAAWITIGLISVLLAAIKLFA